MAQYYQSIFPNTKILGEHPAVVSIEVLGQKLMLLNGGDLYKPNEAVSLTVECDKQEEIDMYWEGLTKEGKEMECGWCKDKWGVSWQITPRVLTQAYTSSDRAAAKRAFTVMMEMSKIDIATIEAALRG